MRQLKKKKNDWWSHWTPKLRESMANIHGLRLMAASDWVMLATGEDAGGGETAKVYRMSRGMILKQFALTTHLSHLPHLRAHYILNFIADVITQTVCSRRLTCCHNLSCGLWWSWTVSVYLFIHDLFCQILFQNMLSWPHISLIFSLVTHWQ